MFENTLKNKIVFIIILTLVLIDKVFLLTNFNFKYIGSDELIFWQSANDYMHGIFHEPYFYGQNYNFMLESFFAIPLLVLGVPYNIAFPIATSIISFFPFFFFSIILYKRGYIIESLFFILLLLLLPVEYGILTSITRGFVTGLFFCSFLIFPILKPTLKSSWIIGALSLTIGYIFNSNSLIFSLPISLYIFLYNYKKISYYLINLLLILPVLYIEFLAKRFYEINALFAVHGMWKINFNFNLMISNFGFLDHFFAYSMPLFWSAGWLILIVISTLGFIIIKHDWRKGTSVFFGIIFIIFTLGINKVNDHLDTIFLSSTRMFIAIPLFTGVIFMWLNDRLNIKELRFKALFLIIAITVFAVKIGIYRPIIKQHTSRTNYGSVAIKKNEQFCSDCEKLDSITKKENVNLIIFVPNFENNVPSLEFMNYGCPLIINKFPKTLLNVYERRTWVFINEGSSVEKNILIFGSDLNSNTNKPLIEISEYPKMVLIKDNKLRTDSLLKQLNIMYKRNTYN